MTVPVSTGKSGPFNGNGVTKTFAFDFKVFTEEDVLVIYTNADSIDTDYVLDSDYSISLNPDQNVDPGGSITTLATDAVATGTSITLVSNIEADQGTSIPNLSAFYAKVIENALDKLTLIVQSVKRVAENSFRLPDSAPSGISTELPLPEANAIVAWNADADALQNVDVNTLATIVAFGTAVADVFDGDGVTTEFTLSSNPGALNNLDVSIGGVTKTPGIDYTWSAGTTVVFTVAPAAGTDNVLVRYLQALSQGATDSAASTFIQAGTGAVTRDAQSKMREMVSPEDFGAIGNGVANDAAAVQAWLTHLQAGGSGEAKRDAIYNLGTTTLTFSYAATIDSPIEIDFGSAKFSYSGTAYALDVDKSGSAGTAPRCVFKGGQFDVTATAGSGVRLTNCTGIAWFDQPKITNLTGASTGAGLTLRNTSSKWSEKINIPDLEVGAFKYNVALEVSGGTASFARLNMPYIHGGIFDYGFYAPTGCSPYDSVIGIRGNCDPTLTKAGVYVGGATLRGTTIEAVGLEGGRASAFTVTTVAGNPDVVATVGTVSANDVGFGITIPACNLSGNGALRSIITGVNTGTNTFTLQDAPGQSIVGAAATVGTVGVMRDSSFNSQPIIRSVDATSCAFDVYYYSRATAGSSGQETVYGTAVTPSGITDATQEFNCHGGNTSKASFSFVASGNPTATGDLIGSFAGAFRKDTTTQQLKHMADFAVFRGSAADASRAGIRTRASAGALTLRMYSDENGMWVPATTDTYDLGTTSLLWRSIFSVGSLHQTPTSPAQITANQNDYNPSSTSGVWRLNSDAARNITGIAGSASGRRITLVNVGAQNIVIQNQNVGSTTTNRIITGTGADITLAGDDTLDLWYDSTTGRWRVTGGN